MEEFKFTTSNYDEEKVKSLALSKQLEEREKANECLEGECKSLKEQISKIKEELDSTVKVSFPRVCISLACVRGACLSAWILEHSCDGFWNRLSVRLYLRAPLRRPFIYVCKHVYIGCGEFCSRFRL